MQAAALKTFVLAHGSWHGGWCWKRVAHRLREKGHAVYAPSFTGMGDRVHLLNREITIDTFVEDLAQVILTEELNRVLLVGHSFGVLSRISCKRFSALFKVFGLPPSVIAGAKQEHGSVWLGLLPPFLVRERMPDLVSGHLIGLYVGW